jgi:hypothetical protein
MTPTTPKHPRPEPSAGGSTASDAGEGPGDSPDVSVTVIDAFSASGTALRAGAHPTGDRVSGTDKADHEQAGTRRMRSALFQECSNVAYQQPSFAAVSKRRDACRSRA